jgi:hypothetical protein
VGEKKEKARGFWLNSHLLPPPRTRTERGREAARAWPAGGDSRRAGPRQRPGGGGKWRGLHGHSIPLPTLGRDGVWRRVLRRRRTGGGGARCGGAVGGRGARQARLVRCGAARRWWRPFIGVVGRFPGKKSSRRPWRKPQQGGPRRPVRRRLRRGDASAQRLVQSRPNSAGDRTARAAMRRVGQLRRPVRAASKRPARAAGRRGARRGCCGGA